MDLAVCFCGATQFQVEIGYGPKHQIHIICNGCQCRRRVRTPSIGCHYSVQPRLEGYEIDPETGSMRKENELPKTEHMQRKFDKDEFLDKFDKAIDKAEEDDLLDKFQKAIDKAKENS